MRMSFSDYNINKSTLSSRENKRRSNSLGDVLLIEKRATSSSLLKTTLIGFGYHIVHHARLDVDIIEKITLFQPSVLLLATDLPSESMLATLAEINQLLPIPIIIIAENDSPNLIKHAIKSGVSAYVVSEMIPQRLKSIISVANERFKADQTLRNELKRTKDQLESRKYIEKAKGIIMDQKQCNEQQSYSLLRKMAMDQGNSLVQVAKKIIEVHAMLSTP